MFHKLLVKGLLLEKRDATWKRISIHCELTIYICIIRICNDRRKKNVYHPYFASKTFFLENNIYLPFFQPYWHFIYVCRSSEWALFWPLNFAQKMSFYRVTCSAYLSFREIHRAWRIKMYNFQKIYWLKEQGSKWQWKNAHSI